MSLFDVYYQNNSDTICEDIDFNPYDNDPAQVETSFIQNLIQSEPDDNYVQGGL